MSRGKDERGGKGGVRRAGGLSAEEAALWRFVTKDVRPTRGKARVNAVDSGDVEAAGAGRREKPERGSAPHAPRTSTADAKVRPSGVAGGAKPKPAASAIPVATGTMLPSTPFE